MTSRKRSAREQQRREFMASSGGMDDAFARESRRADAMADRREAALIDKACTSKRRYPTRADAREALELSEERGRRGLAIYRCPHCGGWHLTSHPQR